MIYIGVRCVFALKLNKMFTFAAFSKVARRKEREQEREREKKLFQLVLTSALNSQIIVKKANLI